MVTVRDVSLTTGSNTTSATATTSDVGLPSQDEGDVAFRVVWRYIAPLIFIIGMVGNILIILVMRRQKMRGNTAAIYLPLLAIADAVALFSGIIPEWMEACEIIKFKELSAGTCRFEKILFYTSADTAIWILVAFTCDRFIAVCFPLQKSRWCTSKRAWIISGILFGMAFIKNMHVFWTRGVQYDNEGKIFKNCGYPDPAYKHFERNIRPWLVFILVTLIPFLLILSCNLAIVYKLLTAARGKNVTKQKDNRYSQTTLMCVGVSLLFLVTVTPSVVIYIGRTEWDKNSNDAYEVAKAVTNVVVYLNHSLNFFVYCMSGKRFRREFAKLCCVKVQDGSTGLSTAYTIRGRNATWRTTPASISGSASDYYDSSAGSQGVCRNEDIKVQDLHM